MKMDAERRVKERCVHCGGEALTWHGINGIQKICLICGKAFEARRQDDVRKFHEEAEKYQ